MDRNTLNVAEVARLLGISRASAYRAVGRGEIPSIRIGARLLVPRIRLERLLRGTPCEGTTLEEGNAEYA